MKIRVKKTLASEMEMIEVGQVGADDAWLDGYTQASNTVYVPTADLEDYERTVSRKRRKGTLSQIDR